MLIRQKLEGTWILDSFIEYPVNGGDPIYPFGADPKGFIIYASDGYMSAHLSMAYREPFFSGDWFDGSDTEYRLQGTSYISYCGPYDVNELRGELTHTIAVSLFPNWVDQTQPRTFTFDGDYLELGNTSGYLSGGHQVNAKIRWKRALPR